MGTTESHSRTITLSVADMASLKTNQGIAFTTDSDSTEHTQPGTPEARMHVEF